MYVLYTLTYFIIIVKVNNVRYYVVYTRIAIQQHDNIILNIIYFLFNKIMSYYSYKVIYYFLLLRTVVLLLIITIIYILSLSQEL